MSLNLKLLYSDFNFPMDKSSHHKIYEFENFRLDSVSLMLYSNAEEISLPPKAVETLLILVERRGEIVSKDELMEAIWTDSIVEESNLSKYLHVLRKTLGTRSDGKPFIETLRRRGYRFSGEVRFLENVHPTGGNGAKSPKISAAPRYEVERHGNVLALDSWRQSETNSRTSVLTERRIFKS